MTGAVDDVNRANAEAAEYVFSKWVLVPRLERIKQALNADLLPLFGVTDVEFDYESPVQEDAVAVNASRDSRVNAAVSLVAAGFDPAEVLEAMDLPGLSLGATADERADANDLALLVQKLYLGVGTIITWQEGRELLAQAGMDVDLAEPSPVVVAPVSTPAVEPAPEPEQSTSSAPEAPAPPPAEPGRRGTSSGTLTEIFRAAVVDAAEAVDEEREDWQDRLDGLIDDWAAVSKAQRDEIAEQITKIVDEGTPADLATLTVNIDRAADLLADAMLAQADAAGRRTADDAAEQGVSIEPVTPIAPTTNRSGDAKPKATKFLADLAADLRNAARVTASFLAGSYVASAAREALRQWAPASTGAEVAKGVIEHLVGLSDATLRSELGGQVWAAENEGRLSTIEQAIANGTKFKHLEASERRDTNTCGPCAAVDGRRFTTIDAARAEYPFGGYRSCDGRSRCRGTVEAIWK
jgi:hypothetical protein